MLKSFKVKSSWVLLAHVIALLLYHFFGYVGHFGYDDIHYANLSHNLIHGTFDADDHFSYRFSILLSTAFSYVLFGLNDFASSLPAMLFSILCLYMVYGIMKKEKISTLAIALSLTLFSNWYIFYSDKLMPDIYVAFAFMWCLYVLYNYRFKQLMHTYWYALLLVLALFFGFVSKGTIVLIIPLLLYFFIWDFYHKKHLKFWLYLFMNGILILSIYFFLIYWITGDATQRFEALASNAYLNLCSYADQPLKILLQRISYGFFNYMTAHGMLTSYIFLIAFIFRRDIFTYLKANTTFSFFYLSALILLLSSNFMSISLTSYNPMCLDPRHFLFLVPVAAIAAAFIITTFIEEKKMLPQLLIVLFLFGILSYFLEAKSFYYLYLPLFLIFLLFVFIGRNPLAKNLFTVGLIVVLMLIPLEAVIYANKIDYKAQVAVLKEKILSKNQNAYIISDPIQSRLGFYYSGFDTSKHQFLAYGNFQIDSLDSREKLLYINEYTQMKSYLEVQDLPYYAQYLDEGHQLLFGDSNLNISIYRLEKIHLTLKNSQKLLISLNDFEKEYKYWEQNADNISDALVFKGSYSSKIPEYSSTFVYPLDSLSIHSSSDLLIFTRLYLNFLQQTTAQLVISLEDDSSNSLIWKSIPINKSLKAYSHWWEVQYSIRLNSRELKDADQLKIYIWNKDLDEGCMDNFEVQLIQL